MPLSSKQCSVLVEESLLLRLSPLQRKILLELAAGPLTLGKLSERTGSSVYSVGKQLSLLQMRAKYNPLENRGIKKPIVAKLKETGFKTTYFIR